MSEFVQGGMDYRINVTSNFDKVFDDIEKKAKKIGNSSVQNSTSKTGTRASASELAKQSKTQKDMANSSKEQVAIAKKISQLENQIAVVRNKEVKYLQRHADLLKRIDSLDKQRVLAHNKDFQGLVKYEKIQNSIAVKAKTYNRLMSEGRYSSEQATKLAGISSTEAEILGIQKAKVSVSKEELAVQQKLANLNNQKAVLTNNDVSQQSREVEHLKRVDSLAKQRSSYLDNDLVATQKVEAIQNNLALKEMEYNKLMATGNHTKREAAQLIGLSASQAKKLGIRLWDVQTIAEDFLFTFRRLVGILALFTLARKLSQWIAQANSEAVKFNEEMEISEKSIASIIVSLSKVVDAQGNLIKGQEAFDQSVLKSREILQGLRKDAIGSIATFEALTQAFQVAVGPGLSSGLNLDEVRKLTKLLVEGATSLGVPLNQLSEEIRSLLQGTATAKNTRIAVLFGGAAEANKLVREANQQGKLYEVLTERLQGVRKGAESASNSLAVLRSNLKDSFLLLTSTAGMSQMEELKNIFIEIRNIILDIDSEGNVIGVNEQSLGLAREASGIVTTILEKIRTFADPDALLGSFTATLSLISDSLAVIVPLVVEAVNGLALGIQAVLGPLSNVSRFFRDIFGDSDGILKILGKLLEGMIAIKVATWGWAKVLFVIKGLLGVSAILGSLTKIAKLIPSFLAISATVSGPLALGIAAIVGGLIFAVTKLGLVDKFMKSIGSSTEDVSGSTKSLTANFASMGQELEDIDKTFSDLPQKLRDLDVSIAIEKAIRGLKGYAKEVESIQAERLYKLNEQTLNAKEQIKANNLELERLAVMKQGIVIVSKRNNLTASNYALQQEIIKTTTSINSLYTKQLELLKEKNEETIFNKDLEIAQLQAYNSMKEAITSVTNSKQLGVLQAENELAVLKLQREVLDNQGEILEKNKLKLEEFFASPDATIPLEESLKRIDEQLKNMKVGIEVDPAKEQELLNRIKTWEDKIAKASKQSPIAGSASSMGGTLYTSGKVPQEYYDQLEATKAEYDKIHADADGVNLQEKENLETRRELIAKELESARLIRNINEASQESINQQQRDLQNKKQEADTRAYELQVKAAKENIRANGTLLENTKLSLHEWESRMPSAAKAFSDIIVGSIDKLADTVAQIFMDAIDPRTNVDIKTAFGEFFLSLAGDFVSEIVKQLVAQQVAKLLANPITSALSGGASAAAGAGVAGVAGAGAGTAAGATAAEAGTATTAASTTATATATEGAVASGTSVAMTSVLGAMVVPLLGGLLGALLPTKIVIGLLLGVVTGIYIQMFTIVGMLTTQISLLGAILSATVASSVGFGKSGGLVGLAKGGNVRGLAEGGPSFPRPSNIPASDTVPAWLTPNEYVLNTSMVRQVGAGALEAWRKGYAPPPSFAKAGGFVGSNSIVHFASGGSVSKAKTYNQKGSGSKTVVLPVLPTTNENMARMMRGGDRAFNQGVNSVTMLGGKGNPNKSSQW